MNETKMNDSVGFGSTFSENGEILERSRDGCCASRGNGRDGGGGTSESGDGVTVRDEFGDDFGSDPTAVDSMRAKMVFGLVWINVDGDGRGRRSTYLAPVTKTFMLLR